LRRGVGRIETLTGDRSPFGLRRIFLRLFEYGADKNDRRVFFAMQAKTYQANVRYHMTPTPHIALQMLHIKTSAWTGFAWLKEDMQQLRLDPPHRLWQMRVIPRSRFQISLLVVIRLCEVFDPTAKGCPG
jgi:hypothetical protein